MSTIRILGAGAWGTALALLWSQGQGEGRDVSVIELLARTPDEAALLRSARVNSRRLPGVSLPATINIFSATEKLPALGTADVYVVTIPSTEFDSATAKQIVQNAGGAPIVIASKGLSLSGARPSELLIAAGAEEWCIAVLSGPNLASEIALGKPAAAVLAGADQLVDALRTSLARPAFRLYLTDDVVGVEISGALKNVIAIAVSGVRALGYGENAAAALLSRGVAEMARLAEACGGRTETACGLAGVGDLVVTSSNTGSRNAKLGALLASGMSVQAAVDKIGATVEGIGTAHGALQLAAAHKLEMPITAAVVAALDGGTTIEMLARALLGRSPAGEWR
ncbi:MAG: NAD(P)H-dependent glycerol-3-phosphate dehydrogenase [bacterium]|nr:NAD(P)H-dependent glycerol-3-phosphate dehydrogenase [Candidatus Aquidulcis frankliniae]